jgi:hypothetical protein
MPVSSRSRAAEITLTSIVDAEAIARQKGKQGSVKTRTRKLNVCQQTNLEPKCNNNPNIMKMNTNEHHWKSIENLKFYVKQSIKHFYCNVNTYL